MDTMSGLDPEVRARLDSLSYESTKAGSLQQGEFYQCKPDIFAATYEPVLAAGAARETPA